MALPLIQQLQETFGDLGAFTPEKLQALIQETLKAFHLIQSKIQSKDPKEREEGLIMALELKQALERQAEALCKTVGMDPVQLSQFVENPENFSKEEWDTLGVAKQELDVLKKGLNGSNGNGKDNGKKVLKVPKKKNPKTWIVG